MIDHIFFFHIIFLGIHDTAYGSVIKELSVVNLISNLLGEWNDLSEYIFKEHIFLFIVRKTTVAYVTILLTAPRCSS